MSTSLTQPVLFSQAAADRIGNAVRLMEQMQGQSLPTITYPSQQTFWAIILQPTIDGTRFAFLRVAPDPSKSRFDFRIGGPNGMCYQTLGEMGWAMEANNNMQVPQYAIVRMDYIGTDADGKPAFLFQYETLRDEPSLPLHDHRDNFSGGFSFSVFHPGTSLPQQRWAI